MSSQERPDDFEMRRAHLQSMSDEELHVYFWDLVDQIVAPLIEEARTHTTPSIERSVLLRMGFSSIESKQLVEQLHQNGLLGHGAGRLVLELAKTKNITVREAGEALLHGEHWQELNP
ncbi:MAG: ornithine aminomutase subunit alpha [Granulosicoccaceae bacterium]|jgi:D-ornithine 4,5-aminomutase subunit alpha